MICEEKLHIAIHSTPSPKMTGLFSSLFLILIIAFFEARLFGNGINDLGLNGSNLATSRDTYEILQITQPLESFIKLSRRFCN